MNKTLRIILIILGIGLFFTGSVLAAPDDLIVDFQDTPLFNEANFLPGQGITRWVEVTNKSGQTERIATEAINVSDPDGFGDALTLEIKEGDRGIYNGPLSQFFNMGELYLSDLGGGESQTQYDFTITFYPEANNAFQGKTLSFDILIGFQGTGGGVTPGGGGGGGGLPPGLTIHEPVTVVPTETSVTITWTTNYSSTSQVVYAKEGESHTLDLTDKIVGTPPKYGYAQTTLEYNVSPKVTGHKIIIPGLASGTTYYYRCISHGSFAVSTEHSFTTLSVMGEEEPAQISEEIEAGREEPAQISEKIEAGREEPGPITGEEEPAQISEKIEAGRGEPAQISEEIEGGKEDTGLGWLLAAIGGLFRLENLWWILLLFVIIIIILFFLSRKKKKKEE